MLKTHHSALRPTAESFDAAVRFYTELLGFQVAEAWTTYFNQGRPMQCAMIRPGDGMMIEIFGSGQTNAGAVGAIPHMCYETDDVAGLMRRLNAAGYPSTDPNGVPIDRDYTDYPMRESPPMVWRCAFVKGPCGEIIEFLQELSPVCSALSGGKTHGLQEG